MRHRVRVHSYWRKNRYVKGHSRIVESEESPFIEVVGPAPPEGISHKLPRMKESKSHFSTGPPTPFRPVMTPQFITLIPPKGKKVKTFTPRPEETIEDRLLRLGDQ